MSRPASHDTVRVQVHKRYAGIAKSNGSCCATSSCCTPDPLGNASASAALGYSPDEMDAVNSLTMLVLYGVLGGFLLGVGRLPVPWQALLLSIAIYVALPLVTGYLSRT